MRIPADGRAGAIDAELWSVWAAEGFGLGQVLELRELGQRIVLKGGLLGGLGARFGRGGRWGWRSGVGGSDAFELGEELLVGESFLLCHWRRVSHEGCRVGVLVLYEVEWTLEGNSWNLVDIWASCWREWDVDGAAEYGVQKCAYSVYWEGHGMDEGGKDGGCVEGCDWPGEAVVWIRLA